MSESKPLLTNDKNDPRLWWIPDDIKSIPAVMKKLLSSMDENGDILPEFRIPLQIPTASATNLYQISHIQYSKHVPFSVAGPNERTLYINPHWIPPTDCNPDALSAWNSGDPHPPNARSNKDLATTWNAVSGS